MNNNNNNNKFKLLIGLTGSVACIKLEEIIEKFKILSPNIDICLISTQSSLHFVNIHQFNEISSLKERLDYLIKTNTISNSNTLLTFSDQDEWSSWSKRNDPVLHIELRKWADLFLISPLDANTLAKLSNGICDNLLTCVARAWDFKKPIIICPAMNTFMFEHIITNQQLNVLKSWGYKIIDPIEKLLMCGDYGKGAMADVDTIVNTTLMLKKEQE
jgi:phosphopantothenoylcysteine decarboxylase